MIYMIKKLQLVSECLHFYYGTFLLRVVFLTQWFHNIKILYTFLSVYVYSFFFNIDHIWGENKHTWKAHVIIISAWKAIFELTISTFLGCWTKTDKRTNNNHVEILQNLDVFLLTWFYIKLLLWNIHGSSNEICLWF